MIRNGPNPKFKNSCLENKRRRVSGRAVHLRIPCSFKRHQLNITGYGLETVVEIMRNSSGQRSDCLHFLRLNQLCLKCFFSSSARFRSVISESNSSFLSFNSSVLALTCFLNTTSPAAKAVNVPPANTRSQTSQAGNLNGEMLRIYRNSSR